MIGRGKHNDIFLYEVTGQDLMAGDGVGAGYHVGNILMFADKRKVALGEEFARAEDMDAAKEYLRHKTKTEALWTGKPDRKLNELHSQIAERDANLRELTEKIEQRDELLKDVTETLRVQKQENDFLHLQLELARDQLVVDELKHSELMDDLQNVSKETHTIESTLEHVLEEKFCLEQELAEKITELVELDLQNDDLRRQINETKSSSLSGSGGVARGSSSPEHNEAPMPEAGENHNIATPAPPSTVPAPNADAGEHILTLTSGKQIHVLHEFPKAGKPRTSVRIGQALIFASKLLVAVPSVFLILMAASVFATAQVNGISLGDALDSVIKGLGLDLVSLKP
ncbi:MAG TPA: hypothetical protein DEB24_00810 [Coriobacteriia bacterium]|nr:hypothetical protein [Coriobacteriia bacterium]